MTAYAAVYCSDRPNCDTCQFGDCKWVLNGPTQLICEFQRAAHANNSYVPTSVFLGPC